MKQFELLKERNDEVSERLEIVVERLSEIAEAPEVKEPFADYFKKVAQHLLLMKEVSDAVMSGEMLKWDEATGKAYNEKMFGENRNAYATSYLNTTFAVEKLGLEYGQLFSAVYFNLYQKMGSVFSGRRYYVCMYAELVVELYTYLLEEDAEFKGAKDIYYWFMHDYADVDEEDFVQELVNPAYDFGKEFVMTSDLDDLSYLYKAGKIVTDNEIGIAKFLAKLPEEDIVAMATTYTEGYRMGFETTNKSLEGKKTVEVRCPLGFERMARVAVENFAKLGLDSKVVISSTIMNHQAIADHKDDKGLYFDKNMCQRWCECIRTSFEHSKDIAWVYAGPAVIEVFGEEPFSPEVKKENVQLDEAQQKLFVQYQSEYMKAYYGAIDGENRSFTIIAYPIPEIGEKFEEIFAETVKLNTLDYMLYRNIQQNIIDVLDTGVKAHILGTNGNKTDLTVSLYPLNDPSKETIFENCVADVNIPVGEVFTSPVLAGTTGKLHVSQVFLNGLNYKNLEIDFVDGMIVDYNCTNFDDPEEGKKYIKKNVLFNRDTLALGEFAIGTNTTAYKMAREYDIAAKMPILIAEKTGPHFAVGDTCYSHSEDQVVYNPDGKEIVARDNAVSILRKTEPEKAYFNCHTDITIPYDELAHIKAIAADGTEKYIIKDGRFVVPGTEELNKPLDEM